MKLQPGLLYNFALHNLSRQIAFFECVSPDFSSLTLINHLIFNSRICVTMVS